MNDERAFERYVAENVAGQAGGTPLPDAFYDDLREYTDSHRQPPRWLALIKEPPMRTNSQLAVGSPTVRVMAIMAATILLALALAAAGIAGQQLLAADGAIIVAQDGTGDHESIQEAVDAAADGDTILVRDGTYDESVIIDKDVTLRGDGDRDRIVIEISEEMPVTAELATPDLPFSLRLEGSNATIEDLTLRGASSRVEVLGGAPVFSNVHFDGIGRVYGLDPGSRSVPAGVDVQEGSSGTFTDNLFSRATIIMRGGSSPLVSGNTLSPGAIFSDGEGTDPVIEGNEIEAQGSWHAVTAFGAARPEIRDNTITSETFGIYVRYAGWPSGSMDPWPTIAGNVIEGAARGIYLDEGAGAHVEGNSLTDNSIGISVSTLADDRTDAIVRDNVVRGGAIGIKTSGPVAPEVAGNDVAGATHIGVQVSSDGAPILTGNTICDNSTNLEISANATPEIDDTNDICEDAAAE